MTAENMRTILVVLLVTLFLFILIREVICWYFKINERVKLQKEAVKDNEEIIKLLRNIHVPKLPMHFNCRSVMDPRTSGEPTGMEGGGGGDGVDSGNYGDIRR